MRLVLSLGLGFHFSNITKTPSQSIAKKSDQVYSNTQVLTQVKTIQHESRRVRHESRNYHNLL